MAIVIAVVGAIVLVAGVVTVVIMTRTAPATSDGVQPTILTSGEVSAAIVPDVGWEYRRALWSDAEMELASPDRGVTIDVSLHTGDAGDDVASTPDRVGEPSTETLASGLTASHVDTTGGLVADVATGAAVVRFVVFAGEGADLALYRPAIAELLESVTAS